MIRRWIVKYIARAVQEAIARNVLGIRSVIYEYHPEER